MVQTQLRILRLSKQGEGVGEHEGRTVFVEGALPGEDVRVRIDPAGKVLRGELLAVVRSSADRREPACPLYERCGGCDWMHLGEGAQRAAKEEIVLSALKHLGQVERTEVHLLSTVHSPRSMSYRRRAVLHPTKDALGFYERRSHACIPVDRCPALTEVMGDLPGRLSVALGTVKADVEAVHLLAVGQKVSIALAMKAGIKPRHPELAEKVVRDLRLEGAVLTPKEGSPLLIGKPALRVPAPLRPEVPLFLRPDAFSQANEEANAELVKAAVGAAKLSAGDSLLELYSGNGNFTVALAAQAGSVLGVESSSVSLELARRTLTDARLTNIRLVQGDARRVVEGLIREKRTFEVLFADPPRTGAMGIGVWAKALGVRRVVYVACDPAALARDASELRRAGLLPDTLQLIDMFPQTHHVEAVMSFSRGTRAG